MLSFRLALVDAYRSAALVNGEDTDLEPRNPGLAMISRAYFLCVRLIPEIVQRTSKPKK